MAASDERILTDGLAETLFGLTEQEARARLAGGAGNRAPATTSRTYRQIFVENVFTFINMCLFGLGLSLAILGRVADALISTAIISLNVVVSVVQEIRAKRTLDRIALLARPTATVLREGHERVISPDEIVRGDILKVNAGNQILVDGKVITGGRLEVDESLLTGEADRAVKRAGDEVYSGSFCVSGGGYYLAERVGMESLAHQMTASARAFRRVLTPLQREINLVIRIALLFVVYMEFLLVLMSLVQRINLPDSVENSAIVAGLVPNGLFLSIAVAYALGAIRILRFGALVQQANAIESLSHVDMLCLDKTGTLTSNRLRVASVYPLNQTGTETEILQILGAVAASASVANKTTEALRAAYPTSALPLAGEIPFSSARKWSAVAFANNTQQIQRLQGTYALGAPEMLFPYLRRRDDDDERIRLMIDTQINSLAEQGLRVLLLAHSPEHITLVDVGDSSELPAGMEPLGLATLGDELRPEAREALAAFAKAGVGLKLISGDNPYTVAALAKQAGMDSEIRVVSGQDLEHMSESEIAQVAENATIFGRISPQQKQQLVRALRANGHYVAMIGDGANDVLSLKQADLAIAMRSGSDAARAVADVVLMQDSFAVLAPAVAEGQRILNGMQSILKLFLTRICTIGLVIFSSLVVGTFPLELRQGSLVTFFSVGVPSIALAVWARPGAQKPASLVRKLVHFIVPPMLLTSVIGLLLFAGTYVLRQAQAGSLAHGVVLASEDYPVAQSTLTAFLVITGLLLIVLVQPPTTWWAGGSVVTQDRRPAWLAAGMLALFALISLVPALRALFVLSPLGLQEYLLVAGAALIWLLAVRAAWRWRLLSRYLSVAVGAA